MVIFSRKSAYFFQPPRAKFRFLIFFFFTDIGVKLLGVTFSIMNGDRFVMGERVDSITMNLGKGDSVVF